MKAKSLFVTVLSLVLGTSLSAQITVNQDGGGRIGIPTYLIEADQWQAKTDFATGVSREQADSLCLAYADSAFGNKYFAYVCLDTSSAALTIEDWIGRMVAQRSNVYAYFLDWMITANWEHACQYIFIDRESGQMDVVEHTAPPMDFDAWGLIHGPDVGIEDACGYRSVTVNQNVPNPFNGTTKIQCCLPEKAGPAWLVVYDVQGREVLRECVAAGSSEIEIDGKLLPAAGTYVYTVIYGNERLQAKKMYFLKQ